MVSTSEEGLVYGLKLSSVGPGRVTGQDVVHEPTNMDLAMKLYYLRAVYFFRSQAFEGLTIQKIKEPTFTWFNHFFYTCGRFRRSESGRPYIKCNDCGARMIEAHSSKTVEEWMEMEDDSLNKLLVSNQVIGPELHFSPLVLIQITMFKCGGASVGLSWAHVLGDLFSATDFMNALGQVMSTKQPVQPLKPAQLDTKIEGPLRPTPLSKSKDPLSVKRVGPVGDHWIATNNCKMDVFSLHLTAQQLSHLQSKVCGTHSIPTFELICALVWKSVAHVRGGHEPKVVTICKNDPHAHKFGALSNGQVISIVEANCSIMKASLKELVELITTQAVDERGKIEEVMERDQGLSDFILYGANLTFVDLGMIDPYGLEFEGQKPIHVNYIIDGVGEDGVVLVLPAPKGDGKDGDEGKIMTLIMPENEVLELKSELKRVLSIT